MRARHKKEAERRSKAFMIFTVSKIVAEITIIIGFFIFVYFLLKRLL